MKAHIEVSSPVKLTGRVRQMAGLFDVPLSEKQGQSWDHDVAIEGVDWNIGLITGPSGSGKTLLASKLWPLNVVANYTWSDDEAVLDGFPAQMGAREVTALLSSVGFGSPPAWMRPYRTLSNGEKFRATVARALAENPGLVVADEFTSVVDRHVAMAVSHTVQKTIRREKRQFVAVTCHYDVEEWLQPDWVYDVPTRTTGVHPPGTEWKRPQPQIWAKIFPCDRGLWPAFAPHHYLSARLHTEAKCYAAYVDGHPVGFASHTHFPHPRTKNIRMAHRFVVLPDWQGLGLAGAMAAWVGQDLYEKKYRFHFATAHPGLIRHFAKSPRWRQVSGPAKRVGTGRTYRPIRGGMAARALDPRSLGTRSFEYVPPA